jgi:hypothetical protein
MEWLEGRVSILVFVLFRKTPNGEVLIWEESEGIVEVCMGGALGSAAVVSMLVLRAAGLGSGSELVINGAKYLVDDQAGKGWGKRISLREAILLYEMVEGTIRPVEKALIWVLIHKVEIVDEGMEARVGF